VKNTPTPVVLHPWQEKAKSTLLQALRNHSIALDCSDTGTGKTVTACSVAKDLNLPFAIIAPKIVLPAWKEWCSAFGLQPEFVLNYEKLRTGKTKFLKKLGNKQWEWANASKDFLFIFDEVHRCKSYKSQNGAMLEAARPSKILMLSATAAGSPLDMRFTGRLLGLHNGVNFFSWLHKNGVLKAPWGGFIFRGGKKVLVDIHSKIFPEKGVRVKIDELGDAFPSNQINAQTFDISPRIGELYEEVEKEIAELKSKALTDRDPESPLTKRLRMRQEIELLRVPVMVEMAEEFISEGKSVVCFVNFRQTLDALMEKMEKYQPIYIAGDQSETDRQDAVNAFQSNAHYFLVCQIAAGGVGVSLHDLNGRPRVSLISPTYSAIDLKQALGRIHRSGAKSPALQYILFAANSVEEEVSQSVRRKLKNIELLNDGDLLTHN
jgi:superfamily II DNA or RNA helicase